MEKKYQACSQACGHAAGITLAKGVRWGLLGGLAGTIVMDLALIGAFSAPGVPCLTCFSIAADPVARFFTILGNAVMRFSAVLSVDIAGGVPLGVAVHYMIGPAIGASFGAAVARVDILRVTTLKRDVGIAVVYVETVSQPLLAAMLILSGWTVPETLHWYSGALVAHSIAGAVLGFITHYGLNSATVGKRCTPRSPSGTLVI